jgi:hypothetical protein
VRLSSASGLLIGSGTSSTSSADAPATRRMPTLRRGPVLAVVLTAALGLIHVLAVWGRYHVGSFDDDAAYLFAADALAHGHGLTYLLPPGQPLVGAYPAGYPAMLAPFSYLPGDLATYGRLFSVACYLTLFPLTWAVLMRHRFSQITAVIVLVLLALNPVAATYGSMVMAETPFLVVFMLFLLVLHRWDREDHAVTGAGVGVVLLLASMVWIKQAGLGLAAGLILWLLIKRQWSKILLCVAGLVTLSLPLLVARAMSNVPLLGSRYSSEIGSFNGPLLHRVTHLPWQALDLYERWAIPQSILPTNYHPLPLHGVGGALFTALRFCIAPLVLLGAIRYFRRHSQATMVVLGGYLLQTLVYPYTNERRVILVLPVVIACFVLGCQTVLEVLTAAVRAVRKRFDLPTRAGFRAPTPVLAVAALLAISILSIQFTRNYLLPNGKSTSDPGASSSMAMLRALGSPDDIVESDYVWATALYSGHDTRSNAFLSCYDGAVEELANNDNAKYLLTSGFAAQGIGSPCAGATATRFPSWAVRLYRTQQDLTAVYALIGPGTQQPDLSDLAARQPVEAPDVAMITDTVQERQETPASYPQAPIPPGSNHVTFQWTLPDPATVTQVSLGAASADGGTTGVSISLRDPQGQWHVVSQANGPVGEGQDTPFLLDVPTGGTEATAIRVVVAGSGTAQVHDLHALGRTGA